VKEVKASKKTPAKSEGRGRGEKKAKEMAPEEAFEKKVNDLKKKALLEMPRQLPSQTPRVFFAERLKDTNDPTSSAGLVALHEEYRALSASEKEVGFEAGSTRSSSAAKSSCLMLTFPGICRDRSTKSNRQ